MENWIFNIEFSEDWHEDYLDILEEINHEYETIKMEEE